MFLRVGSVVLALVGSLASSPAVHGQWSQAPHRPFGLGTSTFGQTVKSDVNHTVERIKLDYDRNAAWPTPFAQMDRATYRAWFQPCLDRGWELELTLSDACFDENGQLNNMGAARIQQVIRHSPLDRRTLFVYAGSEEVSLARVQQVEQHVQEEFGRAANLLVAATSNYPAPGRGSYAESVTRKFSENMPAPVLNAQAVSGAVGGGGAGGGFGGGQ